MSNLVLTQLGRQAIGEAGASGPLVELVKFRLGTGYGYTPDPLDTTLQGTIVHPVGLLTAVPSNYSTSVDGDGNVTYSLSIIISDDVGDFQFGEIGLYNASDVLIAVKSFETLIAKTKTTSGSTGNTLQFTLYLALKDGVPVISFETVTGETSTIADVASVDLLDPPVASAANIYRTTALDEFGRSITVQKTNDYLWQSPNYEFVVVENLSVTFASATAAYCSGLATYRFLADCQGDVEGRYIMRVRTGSHAGRVRALIVPKLRLNSHAYNLNDMVKINSPLGYWRCTTAGTTDSSPPVFTTTGTVTDGTAVWTWYSSVIDGSGIAWDTSLATPLSPGDKIDMLRVSTSGAKQDTTPPTAAFNKTTSNLSVLFTDTSVAGGAPIVTRIWEFGEGGPRRVIGGSSTTYNYAADGNYVVILTVIDENGLTSVASQTVGVVDSSPAPTAPVANYSYVVDGLTVTFTNLSTDVNGDITGYLWDFDDTTTSTSTNPVHTFPAAGTYNVELQATDVTALSDTETKAIVVTAPLVDYPPEAGFTWSAAGLTVTFTNTSTDPNANITGYLWNFGDGNTSTLSNPTHAYASAGTYTVTLTATDATFLSDDASTSISVSSGSSGGGGCFTGETPIVLRDGSFKQIQELVPDVDRVRSYYVPGMIDESAYRWADWTTTDISGLRYVSSYVRSVTPFTAYEMVKLNGNPGTTPEHLFFTRRGTEYGWRKAGTLVVGDFLIYTDHEEEIHTVEELGGEWTFYAINVEDVDTIITVSPNGLVLSHNLKCKACDDGEGDF